ncbi:MAG: tetratricopeptide repeat protein [Bacteroidetes bacterium]|nr:tetratricopeptide repeat protein [Bacteroidota bacterium]
MKSMNHYLCIATILMSFAVSAQGKKKSDKNAPPAATVPVTKKDSVVAPSEIQEANSGFFNHFFNKYTVATRFADYDVARDALYDIIVENPANDSLLLTLGFLYYENQRYTSAALVGQELLNRNPRNPVALELAGTAFEELKILDKALQNFESLYLATNSFAALYKVAFLQFDLKRYKEAQANADIMLTRKEADEMTVSFVTADKLNKDYPIRVSVLNLLGMIARDSGDSASAKKYFEQALAKAPDFLPAKENMSKLK